MLIKIRSRKQASGEKEADYVEQNDLKTNDFSGGLSISHIQEEPFADDFKDDKFIDKFKFISSKRLECIGEM